MKTHFSGDEYAEKGICGYWSELITDRWHEVTCKKCIANREKYEEACREENELIVQQLGDMADYFRHKQEG